MLVRTLKPSVMFMSIRFLQHTSPPVSQEKGNKTLRSGGPGPVLMGTVLSRDE
jgi:hypothetical protein